MLLLTIFLIFSMLLVMWFDLTRYIIPNWLVGLLLVLYPIAVLMAQTPVEWKMALAAMALVFAVGYIVFAMKWMGGGDIKLLTVCALWVGMKNLPDFLFIVAMLGAGLSIVVLLMRKADMYLPTREDAKPRPRILRDGEAVPYGLAIAIGFIDMIWMGKIPAVMFLPVH